jgi:hypothetical protein
MAATLVALSTILESPLKGFKADTGHSSSTHSDFLLLPSDPLLTLLSLHHHFIQKPILIDAKMFFKLY